MAIEPERDRAVSPSMAEQLTEQWSAKAADTVESIADVVHDTVVRPAVLVARGIVFGLLIAVVGIVVLILLSVALVRLLTVYVFDGRVWAADALLGTLACAGGAILWRLRTRQEPFER